MSLATEFLRFMPFYFWLGMIALALAIYLLWQAGVIDRRGWIVARAPPLPIALANPRDDAWVSGKIECLTSLTVPRFGKPCVYYVYREQEKVQTREGSRWRTVRTETLATNFEIVDKTGRLIVLGDCAEFDGLQQCGPQMEGPSRRHLAAFFPYPAHADAVGSVSEDRRWLGKYGNIPLVVTSRTRAGYLAARERKETRLRYGGGFFLLLGVFVTLLGLSMKLGIPRVERYEVPDHPYFAFANAMAELSRSNIMVSLGIASAVFLLWWFSFTYNMLVTYRERVETACRQIDVDLKNRFDLIPQLVSTIQGYARHEQSLAETLVQLRYDPVTGIGVDRRQAASVALSSIWALAERYPDLKANQLFGQLRNQLTALEEKLAYARQFYNDSLLEYDNTRRKFPAAIVAGLAGRFPSYEPFSVRDSP